MFEERCIYCGGHLVDDSRAFCSDECRTQDAGLESGNVSSSSSALSSPYLGHAGSGEHDVPALIPSALGSSIRGHHSRYSVSSSSASSTSWSVLTDDEDEAGHYNVGNDSVYDSADPTSFDGNSKVTSLPGYASYLTPLSYARRPSGTNNGSSVSQRASSGPFSGHVRSAPRSAPIHHHSQPATDDDDSSDIGSSSRDKSTVKKSKRSRNRASLPAYFSLLQVSSPSSQQPGSSSSSGGQTTIRPSPKVSVGFPYPTTTPHSATSQPTPRGRKRESDVSRPSRFAEHFSSSSRSRSRSRSRPTVDTTPSIPHMAYRARLESQGSKGSSVEQMFDWTSEQPVFPRGRPAVRRNSSPPPKMITNILAMDGPSLPTLRKADSPSRPRQRGRQRPSELDGPGYPLGPGFGNGRSGLLDREQRASRNGFR